MYFNGFPNLRKSKSIKMVLKNSKRAFIIEPIDLELRSAVADPIHSAEPFTNTTDILWKRFLLLVHSMKKDNFDFSNCTRKNYDIYCY